MTPDLVHHPLSSHTDSTRPLRGLLPRTRMGSGRDPVGGGIFLSVYPFCSPGFPGSCGGWLRPWSARGVVRRRKALVGFVETCDPAVPQTRTKNGMYCPTPFCHVPSRLRPSLVHPHSPEPLWRGYLLARSTSPEENRSYGPYRRPGRVVHMGASGGWGWRVW